jgi:hypothetical protein
VGKFAKTSISKAYSHAMAEEVGAQPMPVTDRHRPIWQRAPADSWLTCPTSTVDVRHCRISFVGAFVGRQPAGRGDA